MTKEGKKVDYDPFGLDRVFVLSLFHGFCTAVPKDMRTKLALTEADALQYVMVLRPRVSSFSHRSSFSIRHPAVSMAAWQYYNNLRTAKKEDPQFNGGRGECQISHFSNRINIAKKMGLASSVPPSEIKAITLEQLSQNDWVLVESCHDVVLQTSYPRGIAIRSIATDEVVNDVICRYWERMTVPPADSHLDVEFDGDPGSPDACRSEQSVAAQHATRMTAAQYIYLQLRIATVLLPPMSLQAEILDSIVHDLRIDATLYQKALGFPMSDAPQLYGFRVKSRTNALGGDVFSPKSETMSEIRSTETIQTSDSTAFKAISASAPLDIFASLPDISFGQFWNSMLELSDNWTSSTHPTEHAIFLLELYSEVFADEMQDEELPLINTIRSTTSEPQTRPLDDTLSAKNGDGSAEMLAEFHHMMNSIAGFLHSGSLYRPHIPIIKRASSSYTESCSDDTSDVSDTSDTSDTSSFSGSSLELSSNRVSRKHKRHGGKSRRKGRRRYSVGSGSTSSSYSTSVSASDSTARLQRRSARRYKGTHRGSPHSSDGEIGQKHHKKGSAQHHRGSGDGGRTRRRRRYYNDSDDDDDDDSGQSGGDTEGGHYHRDGVRRRRQRRRTSGMSFDSASSDRSAASIYLRYRCRTTDSRSSIDSNVLLTPEDLRSEANKGHRRGGSGGRRHRHRHGDRGKRDGYYESGSSEEEGESGSDGAGRSGHRRRGMARRHGSRRGRGKHRWSGSSYEDSWSSEDTEVYSVPDDQLTPRSLMRRNEERRRRQERRQQHRQRRRERRRRERRRGGGMSDGSSDSSFQRLPAAELAERRAQLVEKLRAKGINVAPESISEEDILNINEGAISEELLQRLIQGVGYALEDLNESDFLHILLGEQGDQPPSSLSPEVADSVFAALRTQASRRPPETEYARRRREEQERLLREQEGLASKRQSRHHHRRKHAEPLAPPNTPVDVGESPSGTFSLTAPSLPRRRQRPPVVQMPAEGSESELDLLPGLRPPVRLREVARPPKRGLPEHSRVLDTVQVPRVYVPRSGSEVTDFHEHSPKQLEAFYRDIRTDRPIRGRAPLVQPTSTIGGTYHQLPLIRSGYQPYRSAKGPIPPHPPQPRFVPVKLFSLTTKRSFAEALRESLERYIDDKTYLDSFYSGHPE